MTLTAYYGAEPDIYFIETGYSIVVNGILFRVCEDGDGEYFGIAVSTETDTIAWADSAPADSATVITGSNPIGRDLHFTFSGRFRMYADERWVSPSNNYGHNETTWNNSLGTGGNPTYEWNIQGFYVKSGDVIDSLEMVGVTSNANVSDVNIRLVHATGPYGAGFDTDGEGTYTELLTQNSIFGGSTTNDFNKFEYTINQTVAADGVMYIVAQPTSSDSNSRYFRVSGNILGTRTI